MRNIESFPSKHMCLYLSLVERKVAEFYHNMDRRRYLVWLKNLFSSFFFQAIAGVLNVTLQATLIAALDIGRIDLLIGVLWSSNLPYFVPKKDHNMYTSHLFSLFFSWPPFLTKKEEYRN